MRRLISHLRLDREEGQVLPLFAFMLVALLAMAGVVIDGGNLFQHKQALQNAADASAIAAALEISAGNCPNPTPGSGCTAAANYAGTYAGVNGASGTNGDTTTTFASPAAPLPACNQAGHPELAVTDTTPPTQAPGCYVYPYVDDNGKEHDEQVEVWLTRHTSNFFGGILGIGTSTESARAVGAITSGQPPPYTFVSFDSACDNHTLLIRNSGALKVNQNIEINTFCGPQHDAFDLFGPGGTITAPDIFTRSTGWEDHTGTAPPVGKTIFLHGQLPPSGNACPYADSSTVAAQTSPLCPEFNAPNYKDPFRVVPTPSPGTPAWGSSTPVNITKINRMANVATVVTSTPNGFAVNDTVEISGVGSGFDGSFTVASIVNATTFTYTNAGTNTPSIIQKQMTGGVATLTTNAPFTLTTGGQVTVTGVDSIFNVNNFLVAGTTASTFWYTPPAFKLNITNVQLASGIATLTLNSNAALLVGDKVTVSGLTGANAVLNGNFTLLTVAAGNKVTYADNVPAQSLAVNNRAISGATTATITTANSHTFVVGDSVAVATGDSRFDNGGANVTAIAGSTAGTLKYTIAAVTAAYTNASAAAGTAKRITAAAPKFETGDTVAIPAAAGLAYGGGTSPTLTAVSTSSPFSFSYATPTITSMGMSTRAGTTVTVTSASAHGLATGNVVTIAGYDAAHSCFNVGNTAITVTTATKFTFTVPGSCTPAGGGNGGTFKLVTAASVASAGTATLQTTPTISGSGNVTFPASIPATAVTCTGCVTVTDVPATAVSPVGTFTYLGGPAWMPTTASPATAVKSLPGSAGNPAQFYPANGGTLQPGTYYGGICIGLPSGTACNDANCAAALTTQSYSGTAPTLSAAIPNATTSAPITTFNVTQQKISVNDIINIGTEDMQVTGVVNNGGGGQTLTVVRGYMADTAVTSAKGGTAGHASGATITKVVSSQPAVSVTLADGQYIMAGGGFYVCANGSVSAPHVLIFNTEDSKHPAGNGALAQVSLFTLGSILLGPQTSGLYGGLTLMQDHENEVDTTDSCDKKSTKGSATWDIALVAMRSTGVNGALGSISGSIYATDSTHAGNAATSTPGTNRTDFGDAVSGTATLAVMSDCMFFDGANSTFNFDTQQGKLFGLSATLGG